jgi:hypothetical protein
LGNLPFVFLLIKNFLVSSHTSSNAENSSPGHNKKKFKGLHQNYSIPSTEHLVDSWRIQQEDEQQGLAEDSVEHGGVQS